MVGFDTRNNAIVDKIYLCDICKLLLRDPVQFTDCGHRRCQSCIPVQHEQVLF